MANLKVGIPANQQISSDTFFDCKQEDCLEGDGLHHQLLEGLLLHHLQRGNGDDGGLNSHWGRGELADLLVLIDYVDPPHGVGGFEQVVPPCLAEHLIC